MLDKLLSEYAEKFNKAFPLFAVTSDEQEVRKLIEKCLEENKPYKPKYDKGVLYSL